MPKPNATPELREKERQSSESAVPSGTAATPCPGETRGEVPLVELRGVSRLYPTGRKQLFGGYQDHVQAVVDVDLRIFEGETLGLVGESGSGKTTIGRMISGLEAPDAGEIIYRGQPISSLNDAKNPELRREVQMIFQDPFASLNPRQSVYQILSRPLRRHKIVPASEIDREVNRLLELVGLAPNVKYRFPHEFSGGQLQRIGIARALTVRPKLIIADEAVSALDVSIQAQILNLLIDLQKELGLTFLFIGHGLPAVNYISSRVAVMYLGRIMEIAPAKQIFEKGTHPYTQALLRAIPNPDPRLRHEEKEILEGELPSNIDPPSGCVFHPRCVLAEPQCSERVPEMQAANDAPCHCRYSHCLACPVVLRGKDPATQETNEAHETPEQQATRATQETPETQERKSS